MSSLTLATFNCENLFARYNFDKNYDPVGKDGFTINDLAFDIQDEAEKRITAEAILEVDADVIALQEIESLNVLDTFQSRYLPKMKYRYRMLVDSFDPRHIDVAVMSRYPITSVCSHRQERNKSNSSWLFSRDCLEVTIQVNGKDLLLYINHLKSMMEGRQDTRNRRVEQAERVAAIVDARWKASGYDGNFVVLGDLNDYPQTDNSHGQPVTTALNSLLQHPGLVNVVARLPADDQWTHFYASGGEYRQLDYLFLSKALAQKNPAAPDIMRKGLPFRAERYTGDRLPFVGENHPKASDHCPLSMKLELV